MKYGSVCSGIEAATQAWHPLGWTPQWFSEIEPFPCKVLAHHYPEVPNLGDMTKLLNNQTFNDKHIDLLVGGTPCQSFSVAGLRAGLDDERGNLALEFVRLLISKRPRWFLWENVPGVLSSSNGSDFAAILSAWTGRDIEPQKFGSAGIIEGPFYSIAWRVLDSQYFGVPQRRRRVFVVGHLGNDWRPSAAVLFERDSLRRDFTPGGKKRKRTAPAIERGAGAGSWPAAVASTLNCAYGDKMGLENQHINEGAPLFVPVHAFKEQGGCEGGGKGYLGSDELAFTLSRGQDQSIMQPAYGIQANIVDRSERSGGNGLGVKEEEAPTLTKSDRHAVFQPIPINTMTVQGRPSDNGRMGLGIGEPGDPQNTLSKAHHHAVFQPIIIDRAAFNQGVNALYDPVIEQSETNPCLIKRGPNAVCVGSGASLIRRLTPVECERLQGFPDDYTNIPGATDSKRYAALGNSMTVNVMQWIGKRIDDVDYLTETLGF